MQYREPDDPQNEVKLSEDEIRSLSASLRTIPKESSAERVASGVTGAATGLLRSIIGLLRIPLTIAAAVLVFVLLGGVEGNTILGRIGGAVLTLVVAWIALGRLGTWLELSGYRNLR